jgi:hypothetical protein
VCLRCCLCLLFLLVILLRWQSSFLLPAARHEAHFIRLKMPRGLISMFPPSSFPNFTYALQCTCYFQRKLETPVVKSELSYPRAAGGILLMIPFTVLHDRANTDQFHAFPASISALSTPALSAIHLATFSTPSLVFANQLPTWSGTRSSSTT